MNELIGSYRLTGPHPGRGKDLYIEGPSGTIATVHYQPDNLSQEESARCMAEAINAHRIRRMGARNVNDVRSEITKLESELAALAGEPLLIWDGRNGDVRDCPPGGARLYVSWAINDRSYEEWYPTTEAAKAALLKLAHANGRVPDDQGMHVDLTAPGCHSSSARVTRNQHEVHTLLDMVRNGGEVKYTWTIRDDNGNRQGASGRAELEEIWKRRSEPGGAPEGYSWHGERTTSADTHLLGLYRDSEPPQEDEEGNALVKPIAWLKWKSNRTSVSVRPIVGGTWNELSLVIPGGRHG
jgi:hypothetical protein